MITDADYYILQKYITFQLAWLKRSAAVEAISQRRDVYAQIYDRNNSVARFSWMFRCPSVGILLSNDELEDQTSNIAVTSSKIQNYSRCSRSSHCRYINKDKPYRINVELYYYFNIISLANISADDEKELFIKEANRLESRFYCCSKWAMNDTYILKRAHENA